MPNQRHPITWIVVADNCQAKIFRMVKFPKIEKLSFLEHPESRLHKQDLVSDKPGRTFQSGGTTRHAYQASSDPKELEAIKFAVQLAGHLSSALEKGEFNRLYVLAEPSFLGLLRRQFSADVQKTIIAEVAKDFTSCEDSTIEHQLTNI